MTDYLESKKIKLNKISKDDYSRILIVDANIDDQNFLLISFYNATTESEQINTISRLNQLLDDCYLDSTKKSSTCRRLQFIFGCFIRAFSW